ncbi:MAG: hypothetical protein EPO65_07225 [Dehalococcoidia bacterium]|nr:MAG: hypothetical protein EPO65_07225 [Dehalococcoidia bacterium]
MPGETPVDLAILLGGVDGGPLERWMRAALEACALDTAEVARDSGAFARVFLLADRLPSLPVPAGVIVETDAEAGALPFHYGRRLLDWVHRHGVTAMATCGAGSAPLLVGNEWRALVGALGSPALPRCVANNRFSADIYAVAPASTLALLDPAPATDNAVPRRLWDQHGVELIELPRTVQTQFNLDTPSDLAALALVGHSGPRLLALLRDRGAGAMHLDTSRLERAAACLAERAAEVLVAGRISSGTWAYLERESACRIRILAEERGMQSAGTDTDGTARSILGALIEESGPERVFGTLLPEWCDAAFIDIRPALVHLGIRPGRADRFAADAGLPDAIEDPRLAAIVRAALAAPVPVVLGGHSLVGGVLNLVNQWAWDEKDAREGRVGP